LSTKPTSRSPAAGPISIAPSTSTVKSSMCSSRPAETQPPHGDSSRVLEALIPAARHVTDQYVNNSIEADHGRLKARLRPMQGLKRLACAHTVSTRARVRARPTPPPLRDHRRPAAAASGPHHLQRPRTVPLTHSARNEAGVFRPARGQITQQRLQDPQHRRRGNQAPTVAGHGPDLAVPDAGCLCARLRTASRCPVREVRSGRGGR
jgi:hypothetical protein